MKSLIASLMVITLNLSAMNNVYNLCNSTQTEECRCFENQLNTMTKMITKKLTVGLQDNNKLQQITQAIAYCMINTPVLTVDQMYTYNFMYSCANLMGADFHKNWNRVCFLLHSMKKYNFYVRREIYNARNAILKGGTVESAKATEERVKQFLVSCYYNCLSNAEGDTSEEIGKMLMCYCREVHHDNTTLLQLWHYINQYLSPTADENQNVILYFENCILSSYSSKLQQYDIAFYAAIPIIVNDSELKQLFVLIYKSAFELKQQTIQIRQKEASLCNQQKYQQEREMLEKKAKEQCTQKPPEHLKQ